MARRTGGYRLQLLLGRKAAKIDFHGRDFSDWQKLNRDKHSVVANPLFVNPEAMDFRFRSLSVAKKIKFKPFDYSKAGVYGDEDWIRKAQLSPEMLEEFDRKCPLLKNYEL